MKACIKLAILFVLIVPVVSCKVPSEKTTLMPGPTMTISLITTSTPIPTPTFTPFPTDTPIPFGTPYAEYLSVPIPKDAIQGANIGGMYQFTSLQSPADLSDYYQRNLPINSWEILEIGPGNKNGYSVTEINLYISQVNGPMVGVIYIKKSANEAFSRVIISVGSTD